jgi:hypothetical protein
MMKQSQDQTSSKKYINKDSGSAEDCPSMLVNVFGRPPGRFHRSGTTQFLHSGRQPFARLQQYSNWYHNLLSQDKCNASYY